MIDQENLRKSERRTKAKMEHSTKRSRCDGRRRLKHRQTNRYDEKMAML